MWCMLLYLSIQFDIGNMNICSVGDRTCTYVWTYHITIIVNVLNVHVYRKKHTNLHEIIGEKKTNSKYTADILWWIFFSIQLLTLEKRSINLDWRNIVMWYWVTYMCVCVRAEQQFSFVRMNVNYLKLKHATRNVSGAFDEVTSTVCCCICSLFLSLSLSRVQCSTSFYLPLST